MKFEHDCRKKCKNLNDHLFIDHTWERSDVQCALQIYKFMNTGCQRALVDTSS